MVSQKDELEGRVMPNMMRALKVMLSKFPDADPDVVHDIAIDRLLEVSALINRGSVTFENENAYIGFCLRYFSVRVIKALQAQRERAMLELKDEPVLSEATMLSEQTRAQMFASIETLPPGDRAIIEGYHLEGRTDLELARNLLGIQGAVPDRDRRRIQRRRHEILQRLRQQFEAIADWCEVSVGV